MSLLSFHRFLGFFSALLFSFVARALDPGAIHSFTFRPGGSIIVVVVVVLDSPPPVRRPGRGGTLLLLASGGCVPL